MLRMTEWSLNEKGIRLNRESSVMRSMTYWSIYF
jgi:hypothetical protein